MKGFLIRGTLRPNMGSVTGQQRNLTAAGQVPQAKTFGIRPPNRIPSSISIKRNSGMR